MHAIVIELFYLRTDLGEDVKVVHLYKENAPFWGALVETFIARCECGEEHLQCQDCSFFFGVGVHNITLLIHLDFDGFKGFQVFYDGDQCFDAIHTL
jgi:hypothetical protein